MYELNAPGHLAAPVAWTKGGTRLDFMISASELAIVQDGRKLATAPLTGDLAKRVAGITDWKPVRYGTGLYGTFGGKSVLPATK